MLLLNRGRRRAASSEALQTMMMAKSRPMLLPKSSPVVSSGLTLFPRGLLVCLVLTTLISDFIVNHHDLLVSLGPGAALVAVLAETVGRASPAVVPMASPALLKFQRLSFEALNQFSSFGTLENG
jgi:hypothetical protein